MDQESISETPLATVLVRYWEGHAKHIASARAQKIQLAYWAEFWREALISQLTIARQEEFVEWLRSKELSSSYVKKIMASGMAALNRAHERQEIQSPPKIIKVKERNPAQRTLELPEVRALVEASRPTPHLFMFIMLGLNTLSRPGALLELSRFQCDLEHRIIYLNPPEREQTKKRRPIVPITETLYPLIEQAPAGHLVQFRGRPLERITTAWNKCVQRADIGEGVVPMTLRRTMATELRRRRVQPWDVAGIMGHSSSESTTEIYAKYDVGYQRDTVRAIDSYMNEILNPEGSCPPRVQLVK